MKRTLDRVIDVARAGKPHSQRPQGWDKVVKRNNRELWRGSACHYTAVLPAASLRSTLYIYKPSHYRYPLGTGIPVTVAGGKLRTT